MILRDGWKIILKDKTGRETDSFNVRETGKFISELINKLKSQRKKHINLNP